MRKKSHISLAGFLVNGLENEVLSRRWKAFYVGSLLPDCKPSFLTVRHEYDETFEIVEDKIRHLIKKRRELREDSFRYMVDLGQVFHYIADYFTFPHNTNYPGNLKDHCIYERNLKSELYSYIREGNASFSSDSSDKISSVDDILKYIRKSHKEYMENFRSVSEDCEYITRVCSRVLTAMWLLSGTPTAACAGV
ncbi:MAG: zinc dependent phospholipase C family protein [Lachnospiraceae bacterium]